MSGLAGAAIAVVLALGGAHPAPAAPREIVVSAAASLKNVFQELGEIYEGQTGVRALFNFAASGVLQRQIETGAPVDVFAGAAPAQMDGLERAGLIVAGTRAVFARNTLVLIVPAETALSIQGFADLERPEVTRVAIGNPATVPAGQYAREALTGLGLWEKLRTRYILAENVRQVLDYVSRGEVDAGVVYSTDAAVAGSRVRVAAVVPAQLHQEILYPIAVVRGSSHVEAATAFVRLVLSPAGRSILARYGFGIPD